MLVLSESWQTLGAEYLPIELLVYSFGPSDGLSKSELLDRHFLNCKIFPSRALCLCSSVLEIYLVRESRDMLLL